MDETTLKLLQDLAQKVAGEIQQRDRPPRKPPSNAKTWPEDLIQRPPDDLDLIGEQTLNLAKAIENYLKR
jgi:hypothetical protein